MLPKGWKRLQLGEIAEIDRRSLGPNTSSDFVFRYISLSDVSNGLIQPQLKRHTFAEAPSRARRLVSCGDILFSSVRPQLKGHAHLTHNHADCVVSTGFSVLSAKPGIDSRYLFNYLFSRDIERQINALVAGSSFPAIGSSDVADLEINLPDFKTQSLIADILTTWDEAIANTGKLLFETTRYQHALINALLLPVPCPAEDRDSAYPPSVQPGVPRLPPARKGWRKTTLGAHLYEVCRPVCVRSDATYTLVTVRRSRGGVDKRGVLTGSEIKTPSQFLVKAGDFLISKRQIVHGACGIVPPELDGAIVSNEYAVINSDGEIDAKFLRYLSESRYFQQTCFHSSIGVHVEKMIFKTERWLSWPFNIPAVHEQLRIVEILDTVSAEVKVLTRQLDALKQEKRALMAQLLTGKRRVRIPKAIAKAA